jgi:rSAM/selenodomain-associated transferase 2/rSAM/selenodomain-associated transferase 1
LGLRLSIVLPALDEAATIARTLDALAPLRAAGHEVIVVDGGSIDGTVALARARADRVITADRGRATQMNAGAAASSGDILLFLHADSRLPPAADLAIGRAVARGRRWGRFDVSIDGRSRWLPLVARLVSLRSRLTGIATGDQGMFVGRELFARVGGFPVQPLMEDIALSRSLKRAAGRPAALRERIVTSGRRWDEHGAWRTIVLMWRLRLAYALGADPARLARAYQPPRKPRVLQVFAKAPQPGSVKTRLAAAIGADAATAAYRELVERTLVVAAEARRRGVVDAVEVWCSPDTSHPAFAGWAAKAHATLRAQASGDLGARMRAALEEALARGALPLLVGTDCPGLDASYLARASLALDSHDAVFGLAEDGGYVLVALTRPLPLFDAIAWSTPAVMAETRRALAATGARWQELPALWDVDTAADLERWRVAAAVPA